jgi:3-phenylpropionate/cinnamic acid dioxygenase small subunit
VTFDDRRRLEDRIYRLRTGYAWSQAPASRTVRMIANVEVFAGARPANSDSTSDATRMVRSNFLISEFWGEETRLLAGWAGHRLASRDGRFEIVAKQVNLIDCDRPIRNPSIIL